MFALKNYRFGGNRFLFHLGFFLALFVGAAAAANAATFTVTTVVDNGDNVTPTPGSLREAIILANNEPGLDTIAFQIGSGLQTIQPPSKLPDITDAVIIDGTTQPGFAGRPLVELDGSSAGGNY